MEFKRLISHFVYRIEAKPGGGFIARASDPAVPPIEAATRAELQQKIQATIAARLSSEFGFKLPVGDSEAKFDFHIEHRPEGGFSIHSADPHAESIEIATHDDVASHVLEKLIGLGGKRLPPELAQALSTPGASANVKVSAGKTVTISAGSQTVTFNTQRGQPPTLAIGSRDPSAELMSSAGRDSMSNTPIAFEATSSWFFRVLVALVVLGALAYIFFYHR